LDRKINFISLLFITLSFNIEIASAATTATWGDVVDVKYSLWYDAAHTQEAPGNIGVTLTYIYLSYGSTVPSEVSSLYPEANPNYLQAFKEAVIGLEVNGEKEFVITKEEQPEGYSEYDLYYHIELVNLWYDASGGSSTDESSSSTSRTRTPLPYDDFNAIFAIGAAITVVVGGFFIWNFRSSRNTRSIVSKESLGSSMREQTIKKEKGTLKEIRELADSYLTDLDSSKDQSEVKFRRRRK
jgi:hypothetical protein